MNKQRNTNTDLTPRDWDCVRATCTDRSVEEVCEFLGMTRASYYGHMNFVQEKWQCKTRVGVVLAHIGGMVR